MEKLTKSLCILTALALLAACDKDTDSGVQIPAAKTNFEVSLPGALETYAVEDPQAAGQIAPYYENVVVYLVDAGGNARRITLGPTTKSRQSKSVSNRSRNRRKYSLS